MKKLLTALASVLFLSSAQAQTTDYSLSAGGWANGPTGTTTYTGTQTIQAGPNTWGIGPYTGSTMVGLTPTSPTATYSTMATELGLSAASVSALSAEIAAQNPSGGGTITNGAWTSKNFTFSGPSTFNMYWVYTSTDYVPFNDGSITTLVETSSATTLGKINGVSAQYILLGATNPGTGNYSTGSYGSTGWQIVNYEITTAGTYKLGFASFNQGDTALSPILYVNDGLGTVTQNGQPFNSVAPNDPNMPSIGGSTPTVVSTTPTNPDVVTSTSYGTPVTSNLVLVASTNTGKLFNVAKTTTPVTSTPYTITSVSTPKVIQTWSDNTTTTIIDPNNSATTTTTTGQVHTLGDSSTQNQSASSTTLVDAIKYNTNFPFIVDTLSTPDGAWAIPSYGAFNANGKYAVSGFSGGMQRTNGNNTFGAAFKIGNGSSSKYVNATSEFDSYSGSAYVLTKQPYAWIRATVGTSFNEYRTDTSIPTFALRNTSSVKQNLFYGDVAIYSAKSYNGIRPFIGATAIHSKIDSMSESGSALLSTLPDGKNINKVNPYVGLRYEYNDSVSAEVRATQTQDYKTVVGVKATISRPIRNNVSVYATAGYDRGHNYNNTYGMIGLKVKF